MGSLASIVCDDRHLLEITFASRSVLENEVHVWSLGISQSHLLRREAVDNVDRLVDG